VCGLNADPDVLLGEFDLVVGGSMAQLLVEGLVNVATEQATVTADVLTQATGYLESGTALRASGVEEWERPVAGFRVRFAYSIAISPRITMQLS
jgi:hypothetical protein